MWKCPNCGARFDEAWLSSEPYPGKRDGVDCPNCGVFIAEDELEEAEDGNDPEIMVMVTVALACERLTDDELLALNFAVQLDKDPRDVIGYQKVAFLFDQNGGTTTHDLTKQGLARVVVKRFEGRGA